jgi:hypothetical protein
LVVKFRHGRPISKALFLGNVIHLQNYSLNFHDMTISTSHKSCPITPCANLVNLFEQISRI